MIIHTRVGKLARYANLKRKKTAAIKMDPKFKGELVVVVSRGEYRRLMNKISLLQRRLRRIGEIVSLCNR